MKLRDAFITDEMLDYLDELRESGTTNMFGAAGLCIQCGKPATRFIRCTVCRDKNAKADARYKMRVKAQAINEIRGLAA